MKIFKDTVGGRGKSLPNTCVSTQRKLEMQKRTYKNINGLQQGTNLVMRYARCIVRVYLNKEMYQISILFWELQQEN